MKINNIEYEAILWDTPGQEKLRAILRLYIKAFQIIILVFDVTNIKSLEELNDLIKIVEDHRNNHCIIGIIGNKIDLIENIVVSEEQAKSFAEKYNCKLLLTSAKEDPKRLNSFIENLIIEYYDLYKDDEEEASLISLEVEEKKRKSKDCCLGEVYLSFPERFKARVFQWYVPNIKFK